MDSKNCTTGYRYFPEHKMVLVVYEGHITLKKILSCIEAQYNNKLLQSVPNRLIDFRNAYIDIENSKSGIINEVKYIRNTLDQRQPLDAKEAILVSTPGETAYFYLYLEISQQIGKTVNCFSTLDATLQFFNIEPGNGEITAFTDNLTTLN
ncbi:MAG: hypothetical protein ACQES1_10015 [Bacteroidota bacterium]